MMIKHNFTKSLASSTVSPSFSMHDSFILPEPFELGLGTGKLTKLLTVTEPLIEIGTCVSLVNIVLKRSIIVDFK
jgi:hypothetical protein